MPRNVGALSGAAILLLLMATLCGAEPYPRCANETSLRLGNGSLPILVLEGCPSLDSVGYAIGRTYGDMIKVGG